MKPTIFLAFANDRDAYLQMIVRESKNVYDFLRNYDDKGFIRLRHRENTSLDDIFNYFYHYNNEIFIFHYGGHAGGTHLQLETAAGDPQRIDVHGLAQLLGRQKELRLVFLNGCATQRQVALLHDAGVRAVIATSVAIEDQSATEFAEHFYNSLAHSFTLKEAFKNARDFMVCKSGKTREIEIKKYRDVNWEDMKKNGKKEMPWGLYVHEDHEKVLDWKLPTSIHFVEGDRKLPPAGDIDPINFKLVELLLNEAAFYSDELKDCKQKLEKDKIENYPTVQRDVIDIFPTPIGEHLKNLFKDRLKHNEERLKQLVTIYQTTIEFLCFTMLSELWEAKFENTKININEVYLTEFKEFCELNDDNYKAFNYVKLIEAITRVFYENKSEFFVEELSTLAGSFMAKDEFYYALLFLEKMKSMRKKDSENNAEDNEIEDICIQTQEQLGIILKKLMALFVKYKLTTIKHIETVKHKHKAPKYCHNRIILHKLSVKKMALPKEWDKHTDSNSVILLKNIDDVLEYMSLSPFLIDETALCPGCEKSRLYFFKGKNMADNLYYYELPGKERKKTLILPGEKYPQIKDQFTEFMKSLFNLNLNEDAAAGEHHGRI